VRVIPHKPSNANENRPATLYTPAAKTSKTNVELLGESLFSEEFWSFDAHNGDSILRVTTQHANRGTTPLDQSPDFRLCGPRFPGRLSKRISRRVRSRASLTVSSAW